MATPVIMPRQGQSVESCIITEWKKKKGDAVKSGEILFSYETDKASFEEEAKVDGILLEVFYNAGDEVPVLLNVAVIGNAGENVSQFKQGETNTATTVEPVKESVKQEVITPKVENTTVPVATAPVAEGDAKISPRARNLADKLGVPVQNLAGTGPQGRIIERDVEEYAKSKPLVTPLAMEKAGDEKLVPGTQGSGIGGRVRATDLQVPTNKIYGEDFEVKKLSNMRKIIGQKMLESMQTTAQLTHHLCADARKMQALRAKVKTAVDKGGSDNITLNDMVCYAVVRALKKHPNANGHFLGDSIRTFKKVHLGIAVDTERGLMVPVIRNADDLSIQGLSSQLKALAGACRKGNVDPELLASEAGTFTVSNLGAYGIEMFTPVLNIPQMGILGVNTITYRPGDIGGGMIGFIPVIGLSLTYDHRALDGAPASALLKEIKDEIENLDFSI